MAETQLQENKGLMWRAKTGTAKKDFKNEG
jgi:hypothetical protein